MLLHFDEMSTNLSLFDYADEEDYIDMELTSSTIFCCSTNSSPQSREFEFLKSLTCNDKETTTSPADELFYKGQLLPLHLPPRRQMVQNLLQTTTPFHITFQDSILTYPTCSTAPCTNTNNTPSDSCNISPSESCRVSCELDPNDHFFEWSSELSSFINSHNHHHPTKKTWSKKLKLIKQTILGHKLKASRAYLKSLFTKSACSDESSAKAEAGNLPKAEQDSNLYLKIAKKKHIGRASYPTIAAIIKNMDKEGANEDTNVHRRSFSSAIKRHSPAKCLSSSSSSNSSSVASSSSSSFSLNSNGFHDLHFLRRSSSATEIEGSIEAAIAHCKKSQQILDSKNEHGICSFSAPRICSI